MLNLIHLLADATNSKNHIYDYLLSNHRNMLTTTFLVVNQQFPYQRDLSKNGNVEIQSLIPQKKALHLFFLLYPRQNKNDNTNNNVNFIFY